MSRVSIIDQPISPLKDPALMRIKVRAILAGGAAVEAGGGVNRRQRIVSSE
jgi:hypothetical protein